VQPLHGVWGPAAGTALSAAWDDGERSLRRFLESTAGVEIMTEDEAAALAGGEAWWTSLDTPGELAQRQST
jgi:molybdopterin-guanine dinucleotide biosynthesis protein A